MFQSQATVTDTTTIVLYSVICVLVVGIIGFVGYSWYNHKDEIEKFVKRKRKVKKTAEGEISKDQAAALLSGKNSQAYFGVAESEV